MLERGHETRDSLLRNFFFSLFHETRRPSSHKVCDVDFKLGLFISANYFSF